MSRTFPLCIFFRLFSRDSKSGAGCDGCSTCARPACCYHWRMEGSRLWRRAANRSTRMGWQGKVFGALIGFFATRSVWGAVIGLIIGYVIDQGKVARPAGAGGTGYGPGGSGEVSEVFFRTTFELMGHVAKSDGRVS